jgi:hypothetical protein
MSAAIAVPREQLVSAVARAEGRRVLRHPVFLAGVALSVFAFATQPEVTGAHAGHHYFSVAVGQAYFNLTGWGLLPLALATLLTLNLAALRSRRDRTEETYRSLPTEAATQTAAQLLAIVWAVAIGVVLVAAAFLYLGAGDGLVVDYDGRTAVPSPYELAQGPLVVLVLGILGVALAAWLPRFSVTLLVAFVVFATEVVFVLWTGIHSWARWLFPLANSATLNRSGVTFPPASRADSGLAGFDVAAAGWHLGYLAALAVLLAAVALYRHRSA